MTFDELQAEISLLMTEMQNEPEDRHELRMRLSEILNELRAFGMPVPQDLADLETALEEGADLDGDTPAAEGEPQPKE